MFLSGGTPAAISTVGYGDETPMFVNRNYYSDQAIALTNRAATYAQIYSDQLWVNTLVNKVAFSVARLPLKVYGRTATGRTDERDTPFGRLMRSPNPRLDPFMFWLWTASTYEVYGEALWLKIRPTPSAPPVALEPLHPRNVVVRRTEDGGVEYLYYNGTASAPLQVWADSEIVHFRNYNPMNTTRGVSRIEPLRQTLLGEDAARRAGTAMWKNGARPSVALTHPMSLSDDAYRRLDAAWNQKHGGVDNWAKTAILEEGMIPHVMQLTAEEMQYISSRQLSREECCASYDVPPPVVHILERATFSNITEQMRSMYRDTMAPRLSLYEGAVDKQLRPDFDPSGNQYAEFLLEEVLRGAFEQRVTAYQQGIVSGWLKPSEVRTAENLPPAGPEADKLYVNAATIPMEVAGSLPPVGTNIEVVPQRVKTVGELPETKGCAGCGDPSEHLSKRGLCRSCSGRQGRKEIAA